MDKLLFKCTFCFGSHSISSIHTFKFSLMKQTIVLKIETLLLFKMKFSLKLKTQKVQIHKRKRKRKVKTIILKTLFKQQNLLKKY